MKSQILSMSHHPTIVFAVKELVRYRDLMTGTKTKGFAYFSGRNVKHGDNSLRVGLFEDLLPDRMKSENPFDDEIYIDVDNGQGIIAGVNPRSCLLSVYRLLQEAGCRFLRPGPDGEFVPRNMWSTLSAHIDEKPSYRHRGICIEGAVSEEIFLGIIDWIPKNGMNAYFIQFREGFTFFDRWYDHKNNAFVPSQAKSIDEIRQIVQDGAKAIQLRGLIYHAVGHGWTCEPLGIPGLAWEVMPTIPEGVSQYFAEINGRRELYQGIPLNTNLCYGNPDVRNLIVRNIIDYAENSPEVDVIHFWLADGTNNHCECPICRDTRPADYYVTMLNQLDMDMTKHHLKQKIVFLIYVDLLWQPEKEKLNNPDRFILMFAPITRTYSHPFSPADELPITLPYIRNRLIFPTSVSENLSYLYQWKELSGGSHLDSFDFDYHLLWDQYKDPGYEKIAKVLHADLQNLSSLGLNGLVSCQVQRLFFPTPLLMTVMARTLWNRKADLETIAFDVYQAAFGIDGYKVREVMKQISTLFNPPWLRREEKLINTTQVERLEKIAPLIDSMMPLIQQHIDEPDPCQRQSWKLLALFSDYVVHLSDFCLPLAMGDIENCKIRYTILRDWVFSMETKLLYVFDSEIMVNVFSSLLQSAETSVET